MPSELRALDHHMVLPLVAAIAGDRVEFEASFGGEPRSTAALVKWFARRAQQSALDNHAWVVVAVEHGEVAGFGAVQYENPASCEVTVWVAPGQRGKGVGSQVIHELCAHARETRRVEVRARIRSDNPASQSFFARLGFTRLEPIHAAVMQEWQHWRKHLAAT